MIRAVNIYDLIITLFIFFKLAEFPFFYHLSFHWLWLVVLANILHTIYNYFAITKGWQRGLMMLIIAKVLNLYYSRKRSKLVKQYLKDDKTA